MIRTSMSLAADAFPVTMLPKGTTSASPRTALAASVSFLTVFFQSCRIS